MNAETTPDLIRLTQYSHGAGCGCKIAPKVLDQILHTSIPQPHDDKLLVGNSSRDDAAVYDIGGGQALISTTDFFMPIVDDAYDFGRIASANAISDVYAMGGRPVLAIAVLGWPIDKLAPEVARRVIEGSRSICLEAGIPLAGGHSIDSPEPIFGLAVTGLLAIENLKRNDTATAGCELYLTKPLGVGMLTTAQKRGLLQPEHEQIAPLSMMQLNKIGADLGQLTGVRAMTDVTGFGLLGHLSEVCEGSGLTAEIDFAKVPLLPEAEIYRQQKAIPGGTVRNWDSYGHKIGALTEEQRQWLCDPQTSGGLLVCVEPTERAAAQAVFAKYGLALESFGTLRPHQANEPWILVR
ncbi:selenide, water dikinase SelD [Hymenobacter lutimineralis]|uniref:Selenide, water dikinase n=1 Tax=Hymenobacter lutimineralis TaxID=2606448 RepID=A0A5D6V934_9BACT|nr:MULTISPECIES: selenide, water dikinase SelD [Hymenobacter]QIX62009.1 selenide, water dikinase SelD [Hymenobacter sp. BT18]TYZ12481.1 selenide, water dikinase SelD [Hymenobacter lutimineralis]